MTKNLILTKDKIQEMLNRYQANGTNFSEFYQIYKDEIKKWLWKEPSILGYGEDFFPEFTFFEDYYYRIILDCLENNIKEVIDIGAQFGLQSALFVDAGINYIGVEPNEDEIFFRDGYISELGAKTTYLPYLLLDDRVDLTNQVVVSSMSIGFFEKDEEEFKNNFKKLATSSRLYYVGPEKGIEELKKLDKKLITKEKSDFSEFCVFV